MRKKIILPTDCVLGITYACNSRCIMCDIWQIQNPPFIDPQEYSKLPRTLKDINISGGEPFLHPRIVEIVRILAKTCPRARIVISTNGFVPDLITEKMREILSIKPDIGIALSVDGVGEMHERVRGIPNAWNKVIDTLERLQKLGMKNLRFAFTILDENVEHFNKVYDETRRRGIQFTHSFAQSSDHFFGGKRVKTNARNEKLKEAYQYVVNRELKSWNIKRWLRAYFAYGLYQFAVSQKQILGSDPGEKYFYLDPSGVVFPSVVDNFPMGNIKDFTVWDELWNSSEAVKARELLKTKGTPAWMICTARTAIKKHPVRVGWWVLRGKLGGVRL